jgi:hypothetical protein
MSVNPTVLGVIAGYILKLDDFESFQQLSIDSYMACLMECAQASYFTISRNDGVALCGRYFVDFACLWQSLDNYYYMIGDRSGRCLSLGWVLSSAKAIKFIDCPYNPATALPIISGLIYTNFCTNSITFGNFQHIHEIPYKFLYGASSIVFLDLSGLYAVSEIADQVFAQCIGLQRIVFPRVIAVKKIGHYFLYRCKKLADVNLSCFSRLEWAGVSFLDGCKSLENIDMSTAIRIRTIGIGAFSECRKLKYADISGFRSLKVIPVIFMLRCVSLERLILPKQALTVEIEDSFLQECSAIKTLDMSGYTNVMKIGDKFMYRCESLESMNMSFLLEVRSYTVIFHGRMHQS